MARKLFVALLVLVLVVGGYFAYEMWLRSTGGADVMVRIPEGAAFDEVLDSLEAAEQDPAIRVVVFQADGDSFTAGNDLQDFAAQATGAFTGERHVLRFLKALAHATRPLVAAVHGQAVGVGTTMLLHCDLVFVTPDARLTTPFVNLALVPEAASSWLLPARIGHARAYAMFALGEAVDNTDRVGAVQ